MPVTMAQVVIFAVASIAVGAPDSRQTIAAAVFPLSSPYVLIARAAELPGLWPHVVAVLWQLMWVALFLRVASGIFRRNVLKSGRVRSKGRRVRRRANEQTASSL
jgi:ABC-2 type transport system permease protein